MAAGTCLGAKDVASLQISIYERFLSEAVQVPAAINHQPGLLTFINGRLTACQIFEVHPVTDRIEQLSVMLDPQKLKSLALIARQQG